MEKRQRLGFRVFLNNAINGFSVAYAAQNKEGAWKRTSSRHFHMSHWARMIQDVVARCSKMQAHGFEVEVVSEVGKGGKRDRKG